MNECKYVSMYMWMNGWIDGWMYGWMYTYTYLCDGDGGRLRVEDTVCIGWEVVMIEPIREYLISRQ
jgi:hypothetical protein